jgi:Fe-S-cluster containining protein
VKPCNQCGKCCINYSDGGLDATTDEIEWWEIHRPNIFRYVSNGNIWTSPETGEQLSRCPWLRQDTSDGKYTCDIYFDRPDDCKHYPVTIAQMVVDECEMLEVKDLKNTKNAQVMLDKLMIDSRPAVT